MILLPTITVTLFVVLAVALIFYPRNKTANRILAVVLFFGCLNRFFLGHETEARQLSPLFIGLEFPLAMLSLCGFYIYLMVSAGPNLNFPKILTIPVGIATMWWIGIHAAGFPVIEEQRTRVITQFIFATIYCIFIWRLFISIKSELGNVESVRSSSSLRWLKTMMIGLTVFWVGFYADLVTSKDAMVSDQYRDIGYMFMLLSLVIAALLSSRALENARMDMQSTAPPYMLPPERLTKLKDQLEELFRKERPHLNPNLRLSTLADAMGVKPYEISLVLKRALNTNFFDYVNRHRIEDVKRRLHDPKYKHLNILGVATECGFNSKSSFSEAFKKWTGKSPSEFKSGRPS